MTPAEFKAWFDGFTEGIAGRPTEKQWARICKRVKDIDGMALLSPRYIVEMWPVIRPWWTSGLAGGYGSATTAGGAGARQGGMTGGATLNCHTSGSTTMRLPEGATDVNFLAALGRSEFSEAA